MKLVFNVSKSDFIKAISFADIEDSLINQLLEKFSEIEELELTREEIIKINEYLPLSFAAITLMHIGKDLNIN